MKYVADPILTRAVLETLEQRQLFASVSLNASGVLTLQGDPAAPNNLVVSLNNSGALVASANTTSKTFPASAVKSIRLIGGYMNDNLHALQGVTAPVYADAGPGDDSLLGASGNDTLLAGHGNDTLDGAAGNDSLSGGDGDDFITGGSGTNVIDGGAGTNSIDGVVGGTPAAAPAASKLAGTVQGTAGSWNGSAGTRDKVFDSDPATYFDAAQGDNTWAGLDLGSAHTITSVRFHPRAGLAWRMVGGAFQGSSDGTTWTTLASLQNEPTDNAYTTINLSSTATYRYVRYLSPNGGYGNVAEVEFYGLPTATTPSDPVPQEQPVSNNPSKLTGASFGTAGSWAGQGATFDKAIDSNPATYFDSTQATGAIVGLDLGAASTLTSVKYWPRTGLGWRMVGGTFQGSNDNATWTTLATITSAPADGAFTTLAISSSTPYRYVRYVAPENGYGNVAEIEFYGQSLPSAPIGVVVPPVAPTNLALQLSPGSSVRLAWSHPNPASVTGYTIERSTAGGAWAAIATTAASATTFTDSGLSAGTTYAYRVRATNGEGPSNPSNVATLTTPTSTTANAPDVQIALMGSTVIAGGTIQASALNTLLKSGSVTSARYEWDFGDPNGAHNKLSGFNAAHVYSNPGTYTLTLKVTDDQGRSASRTATITVTADTRKTIYVDSTAGSDGNSGLSTGAAVKTAARAFQLAGDNTRVLFQRGQTHLLASSLVTAYKNFTVAAYGEGDKPVLKWAGGSEVWWEMIAGSTAGQNVTVRDLAIDGGSTYLTGVAPRGVNFSVINCDFRHLQISINCAGNPTGLLVQDSTQAAGANVTDYWLWLQGTDAVILGNDIGAGGMYGVRTSGGTGQTITRALFANNVFANADRSNLRVQKGSYVYVANNTFTMSGVEFGPLGGGDGKNDPNWATAHTSHVVFESNRMNLGNGKYLRLTAGLEHVSIRNNVLEHNGIGAAIGIEGYDADYGRIVADVTIADNTIIEKSTTGIAIKLQGTENGAQISILNNAYVAPNVVAAASTGSAALWVNDASMGSFREISGNIWGIAKWENYVGPQGYVYVTGSSASGFINPTIWEAYTNVEGDVFQAVTLGDVYRFTVNGVTAGSTLARV